jgi:DNA-binding MarR family transcriptional regulator
MGGTLHPKWEGIARYLARRAGAGGLPSLRELATAAGLRSSQTAHHLRKLEEDGEHEELLPPSEDVWVQGLVVYVVHLPNKRADGGGA